MNLNKKYIPAKFLTGLGLFTLFSLITAAGIGQRILPLHEAINMALKNSYDIQIARNNFEASSINNNLAMAGGLPVVTGSLNDNQSLSNINQKLNTGTEIIRNGNTSNALTSGLAGSFVVFNGFKVYATKNRLAALEKLSEQEINSVIQNTIASVASKYYEVVRQDSYLKTIQQAIDVNRKRREIVEAKKSVGLANNADTYQAQLDLTASEQDFRSQELILFQSKTDLINLMNERVDTSFIIKDTIIIDNNVRLDSIVSSLKVNPQVLTAEQQIRVNEWAEKEVASQRYPSLTLNGGYNYNRNKSGAGNLLLNQNYGPYLGFNVQVPIFNGGIVRRQQRIAEIDTRNSRVTKDNLVFDFETAAVKSWQTYQNNLERLETERQNNKIAADLLNLVFQRFQLGVGTIVDVREAQRSFQEAGFRLVDLTYNAKLAEIELKRLGSKLEF